MSFGFSIGDIILLSQLSYNLWNSITLGRQEASRDLKELESVLFSLRCSLDHLGDVANDVLASVDTRHGGPVFKENLDQMIASCGTTLGDLDALTKKYREAVSSAKETSEGEGKSISFETVTRRIKVNWRKVRWDQEKQSLQYYRDKLESHTSAINLILTSMVLRNTASAEANSKKNHDKTHALLDQVLSNPHTDSSLEKMIKEIHEVLTHPSSRGNPTRSSPMFGQNDSPDSTPQGSLMPKMDSVCAFAINHVAFPNAAGRGAVDDVHFSHYDASIGNSHESAYTVRTSKAKPRELPSEQSIPNTLPPSTIQLNAKRRAFASTEFKAFKQKYSKPQNPQKPAFLCTFTPTVQQLQDGVTYIFRSLPPGSDLYISSSQITERENNIIRWTNGFREYVNNGMENDSTQNEDVVSLLTLLNEAVEKSSDDVKNMFYQASDQGRLLEVLARLQEVSRSVRVLKEIEEFEDAREDWG